MLVVLSPHADQSLILALAVHLFENQLVRRVPHNAFNVEFGIYWRLVRVAIDLHQLFRDARPIDLMVFTCTLNRLTNTNNGTQSELRLFLHS